eukprot:196768_1
MRPWLRFEISDFSHFTKVKTMGNDASHLGWRRRSFHSFGSNEFHLMYGGRRRRQVTLSSRSSSQVEEAKDQFDRFVFATDFDFMPRSAKLKKQIFGHMTKDARNAVRQHVDSMNAKVSFRANKNRYRGQARVFAGSVHKRTNLSLFFVSFVNFLYRDINNP